MTTIASTPPVGTTPPTARPDTDVNAGGGVQGVIGDLIRSSAAGYKAATKASAVEADKAAIHPFEAVSTATGLLKDKTANIKGVSKATGLLHTIGGFGMLILTANVAGTLRSPGDTTVDLANRVADMIDGKDTAEGWNLGWFAPSAGGEGNAPAHASTIGAVLAQSGMK